jgi:hypothetical protein
MKASWLLAIPLFLPVALLAQDPPPAPEANTTAPTPQDLQNRMQQMSEQMARIHGTQDPAERQRLMQEHMQSMNAGMMMMGQTMRGGMGPGRAQGQQCKPDDAACRLDRMQAQQDMMSGRMGMMQMMMQQMTEHMLMQQRSSEAGNAPAGEKP